MNEIEDEARDIVKRLRNHTALGFWCGDNESDMVDHDRGHDPAKNPINKQVIPQVLLELDFQKRYYHPSSPSGGDHPRSDWGGDKRNWGPWHPQHNFRHCREEEARFVSEGGSYAFPSLDLTQLMIPENRQYPLGNKTWKLHCGDVDLFARDFWKLTFNAAKYFGEVTSVEEAVKVTQFSQAWGMKLLVERCRQQKGECGGVILWKLSDAWPCIDAGLIDFGLTPRLAYQFVKNAYTPFTVSMSQNLKDEKELILWAVNDLPGTVFALWKLCVWEITFDEKKEVIKAALVNEETGKLQSPGDSSVSFHHITTKHFDPRRTVFQCEAFDLSGRLLCTSQYTLEPINAYLFHQFIEKQGES